MRHRYGLAFLILILPPLVLLLVRSVPLIALPKAIIVELKPWCFVRVIPKLDPIEALCKEAVPAADPVNRPVPGSQPQGNAAGAEQHGPMNPAGRPAPGTNSPRQTSPPAASGALSSEKQTSRPRAPTLAQLRATEAKARTTFGIASAMLEAIAVSGLVFAIVQICWNWCAAASAGAPDDPDRARDRWFVFGFAVVAVAAAVIMYCRDIASESYDNILVNLMLTASVTSNALSAQSADVFHILLKLNLLIAYVAAALLLVYLASLAIRSPASGETKDRLSGFQFAVAIGGAIFAVGAYANQTALAWATLAVDENIGAPLLEAVKAIADLWAIASSAFLFTAIATGYFGIRANSANVSVQQQPDSALALRTPSGDDFKALGWIVQFVVALAPVWLPVGLAKLLESASKLPGQ